MSTLTLTPEYAAYGLPHSKGVSDDAQKIDRRLAEARQELRGVASAEQYAHTSHALDQALEEYGVENWDGYGAKPIDQKAYLHAQQFLHNLPTLIPAPEVGVDPDGEVSLDWIISPWYTMSISIGADGTLSYAALFGENTAHGREKSGETIPRSILDNLRRLFSEGRQAD